MPTITITAKSDKNLPGRLTLESWQSDWNDKFRRMAPCPPAPHPGGGCTGLMVQSNVATFTVTVLTNVQQIEGVVNPTMEAAGYQPMGPDVLWTVTP